MDCGTIFGIACTSCMTIACLVGIHVCRHLNSALKSADEPSPTVIPNVASTENLCSMCKSGSCQDLTIAEELPSE